MMPRLATPAPVPAPAAPRAAGKGPEAAEAVRQAQEPRAAGSVAVKNYQAEPVREFRVEARGFHNGQSDLTLAAYQDGVRLGFLDYSRYGDDISVQIVFVEEGARRQGVGTALLQELQRQSPTTEISLGMSTEEGSTLVESLAFREVPSPEAGLFEELARLIPERDRLQALCDESLDPKWETAEGRALFLREMEHFNEVHDRLWELEQDTWGKAPVKRLIVLPEDPVRTFGPAQVETEAFGLWFGVPDPQTPYSRSRVVDGEGRPLRVFHGTKGAFRSFDLKRIGSGDPGFHGAGFYFTEDPGLASDYSNSLGSGSVMPVYLNLRRPLEIPRLAPREVWRENYHRLLAEAGVPEGASRSERTEALILAGYDGVIVWGERGEMKEIVAFYPNQIKSALANCGDFDPANEDICA